MTAPTVYHAPAPVPLCTTRPPEWWELDNPGNGLARDLCSRCEFRAACEPGPDERVVGVIRAGRGYPDGLESPRVRAIFTAHHDLIGELAAQGVSGRQIAERVGASRNVTYAYLKANWPGRRAPRSTYRGVTWHTRSSSWNARIHIDGKKVHLGSFADELDAARAYDARARKLGRPLNFPDEAAA